MYKVHCSNCHWWGIIEADVIPELACPICLSDQYLEYEDNEEEKLLACRKYPTTYMARLALAASYRNKCHATVLESLNCQTSQLENSEDV